MSSSQRLVLTILGILACLRPSSGTGAESSGTPFFESRARQILKTHCWHCHGEEVEIQAGLDLRLVRSIRRGGDSGPAIEPGASSSSLLMERIVAGEMPPGGPGKSLSSAEIEVLQQWIDEGAQTARPEPETLDSQSPWTYEEQNHWAFLPSATPSVPTSADESAATSPIDAFVLKQLADHGLGLSPPASRRTLIRRLSFDLLGHPPSPEEIDRFLADDSPTAYRSLVDRFLASPSYGERWGRHWLDTAGYADSDGYTQEDRLRPWIFRYRDYVVGSLNADKPYDQFLTEQIAGDELVDPSFTDLDASAAEKLTATGFLVLAPDGTGQGEADPVLTRNEFVAESIKVFSSTFLGLTVGCAQCHNHRYDPISQVDYFRLRALFEPAFNLPQWRDRGARLVSLWNPSERQAAAMVDAELSQLETQRLAELDAIVAEVFDKEVAKLPAELQQVARDGRTAPADQRTPQQLAIIKEHPSLNVDRGSVYLYEPGKTQELTKKYDQLVATARGNRPAERFLDVLAEVPGSIPTTFLHYRGDPTQPREEILPGELSIFSRAASFAPDDPQRPTSGRRLAYARHLTSGQHPLTARVIVNRLWMHHFGRGLVATPADFGILGEPPSHPELLDWLADQLVRSGWSLKQIHRRILLSQTYQQSSIRTAAFEQVDPENRLLGRMNLRRLEAETIRDAMIEVSGMQNRIMGGPPETVNPDDVGQVIIGDATRDGNGILVAPFVDGPAHYRRSIYVQVRRSMPLGLLEPFDLPSMTPNCDQRSSSTVAPQALLMMNNRQAILLAEHFARRISRECPGDPTKQASRGWELALGYPPSIAQAERACRLLTHLRQEHQQLEQKIAAGELPPETRRSELPAEIEALAIYCQSLFSSNPFLYVD